MTTRINLLDWRAERRERRKKQFAALLGVGLGAGVLATAIAWAAVTAAHGNQQDRNDFLRAEIRDMDRKIKEIEELEKVRSNLLARMQVIEELQANRAAMVHFFDEMLNVLPEGINLTSIKEQGNKLTINGLADSNGRISTYMKNLDASSWFKDPRLVVIKSNDKDRRRKSEFTLTVTMLSRPGDKQANGETEVSE